MSFALLTKKPASPRQTKRLMIAFAAALFALAGAVASMR